MLDLRLATETLDVTLPGKKNVIGKRHPLTVVLDELKEIVIGMGFEIAQGPEVELDYYNFEALNIPKGPSGARHRDTFYINDNVVLRTQPPNPDPRYGNQKPPIRILAPGRVYRADEVDATHSPLFHQVEGLMVDKNITMADLKGTLEVFVKNCTARIPLFASDRTTSHSPSLLPSWTFSASTATARMQPVQGRGAGSKSLGCGMVHPKVLTNCASTRRNTAACVRHGSGAYGYVCATTSTTCACSMITTSASSTSSNQTAGKSVSFKIIHTAR